MTAANRHRAPVPPSRAPRRTARALLLAATSLGTIAAAPGTAHASRDAVMDGAALTGPGVDAPAPVAPPIAGPHADHAS
ncbi:hypothetical protein [Streptacidiphilus anmyonensis]|uniref:hypothetical protein n=1 Tax=Streptacidiphilus anmyonensis TaxID=405782 RepID=UPI0005AB4E6D|nr:hypothetical protein [Streptacidiphilus anmyonensis]